MKWLSAILLGAIIGFTLPLVVGGSGGSWMETWTKYGTVRPVAGSPGLLFSLPLALGVAIAFRLFFDWHRN